MTFLDFVLYYPSDPNSRTFWEMLLSCGFATLSLFSAGVLSIPVALVVIIRVRILAWSLFASAIPFTMFTLCGLAVAWSITGYMSGPDYETIGHHLATQFRLVLGGLLISILLKIVSFRIARRQVTPQRELAET